MNPEEREAIGNYVAVTDNVLREFSKIIEAGDHLLNVLGKPYTEEQPKAEKPTLEEISSLNTEDKVSDKGPYKTISKTNNQNNSAFQKLQSYIKQHNNFVVLHGYKMWNFQNSDIIGKKKT